MPARGYLLDTHVFVWAVAKPAKLSAATRRVIERGNLFISALSAWEIGLKRYSDKPLLPRGQAADDAARAIGAEWIALLPEHAEAATFLDGMHADPVDRMLVATARAENLVLLTRDASILELAAPMLGPLLKEA